ncbi:hypothetical protein pdam_00002324, partial [Pocillopora damicornis]
VFIRLSGIGCLNMNKMLLEGEEMLIFKQNLFKVMISRVSLGFPKSVVMLNSTIISLRCCLL